MYKKIAMLTSLIIHTLGYAELSLQEKLFKAAQEGDIEFLQKAHMVMEDLSIKDAHGNGLVHIAAQHGHVEAIKIITAEHSFGYYGFFLWFWYQIWGPSMPTLEDTNNNGDTPLHCAALHNKTDVINYLASKDVNVLAKNKHHLIPLIAAIKNKKFSCIEAFLRMDSKKVHAMLAHKIDGKNLLTIAIEENNPQAIFLLSRYPALRETLDDHGKSSLHYAAEYKNHIAQKTLLAKGTPVDIKDAKGNTPLYYADQIGDDEGVMLLLEHHANPNTQNNKGDTRLHEKVRNGDLEGVKRLINAHIDLNIQNNQEETALHIAVKTNNSAMVQLLVSNKPNASLKAKGLTPFMLAVDEGKLAIAHILKSVSDINEVDSDGRTALMRALARNNKPSFVYMQNAGACVTTVDIHGNSIVHIAAFNNQDDYELLTSLLHNNQELYTPFINQKNKKGDTPLHLCTNAQALRLLLNLQPNIHIKNINGYTPLHTYADVGDRERIKALIHYDSTCLTDLTNKKNSALSLALGAKRWHCIESLIDPAIINTQNEYGYTPLQIGISRHAPTQPLQVLITHGAHTRVKDKKDNTCLHLALQYNNTDAVELFAQDPHLINAHNIYNQAPIHMACGITDTKALRIVLSSRDLDINSKGPDSKTALICATNQNKTDMVTLLLQKNAHVNVEDVYGWSAAMYAVENNSLECIRHLYNAGANLNVKTPEGDTLMHLAAEFGTDTMLHYLEQKGLSRTTLNNAKQTPLIKAAEKGNNKAVQYLVTDDDYRSNDIQHAYNAAKKNNHIPTMALIESGNLTRKKLCQEIETELRHLRTLIQQNKIHNDTLIKYQQQGYTNFSYAYPLSSDIKRYSSDDIWAMDETKRNALKAKIQARYNTEYHHNQKLASTLHDIRNYIEKEKAYEQECNTIISMRDRVYNSQLKDEAKRLEEIAYLKQQIHGPLPFEEYRYQPSPCSRQSPLTNDAIFRMSDTQRKEYTRTLLQCQNSIGQERPKQELFAQKLGLYIQDQKNQALKEQLEKQREHTKQVYAQPIPTPQTEPNQMHNVQPAQPAPSHSYTLADLSDPSASEECFSCCQGNGDQDEKGRGATSIAIHRIPCPTCKQGSARICQYCVKECRQSGRCPTCNLESKLDDFSPHQDQGPVKIEEQEQPQ